MASSKMTYKNEKYLHSYWLIRKRQGILISDMDHYRESDCAPLQCSESKMVEQCQQHINLSFRTLIGSSQSKIKYVLHVTMSYS